MENIINIIISILKDNPILILVGILGSFASIVGLPLSIYSLRILKKQICYSIKTLIVINDFNNKYSGLTIFHNNKPVKSFCVSKLYIWNSGCKLLTNNDIYDEKPLTFSVEDGFEILDFSVIYKTDDLCKFNIQRLENNIIKICIENMESGCGAVIQILHTDDKKNEQQLKGKIKDNGKIHKYPHKYIEIFELLLLFFLLLPIAFKLIYTTNNNDINLAKSLANFVSNNNDTHINSILEFIKRNRLLPRLLPLSLFGFIKESLMAIYVFTCCLMPKLVVARKYKKIYYKLNKEIGDNADWLK